MFILYLTWIIICTGVTAQDALIVQCNHKAPRTIEFLINLEEPFKLTISSIELAKQ